MPRTRNICELVGPLAALSQYSCIESRLSAPLIVVLSAMIGSSTFVSIRCSNPVAVWWKLSKVASNNEAPLRPGHAVDSTVQVTVSTEHLESLNLFHIDDSRHQFDDLLVVPQPKLPPSVSDGSPKQVTVFPWTNTGSATMWHEMDI